MLFIDPDRIYGILVKSGVIECHLQYDMYEIALAREVQRLSCELCTHTRALSPNKVKSIFAQYRVQLQPKVQPGV